jgi:hypothetical protein
MCPLITKPAEDWARTGGWLVPDDNCSWLEYMITRRALCDSGILEDPWASNRGTRIDRMTRRSGSPLGSYWCGIEAGAVWLDCGAVIYGPSRTNGTHIEIVTRTRVGRPDWPRANDNLTCGGNRGAGGSGTNNGLGVFHELQSRTDVLGYVRPVPVSGWTIVQFAPPWFLLEHWVSLPERERALAGNKIEDFLRAAQPA